MVMSGPPGSGKTMLARRMPGILPPLTLEERIEVTKIHSASGEGNGALVSRRPFRAPHHTVSTSGLAGGGSNPRPGEVSLANHGVLFLDELPEFSRTACEALRQPLEEGEVTVSRAMTSVRFPARFALVAAANPCPCGHLGDSRFACRCSLYDQAGRLSAEELTDGAEAEPPAPVRARVLAARARQRSRQGAENGRLASA